MKSGELMVFCNHRTHSVVAVLSLRSKSGWYASDFLRSNHSVEKILLFLVPSRHQFSQWSTMKLLFWKGLVLNSWCYGTSVETTVPGPLNSKMEICWNLLLETLPRKSHFSRSSLDVYSVPVVFLYRPHVFSIFTALKRILAADVAKRTICSNKVLSRMCSMEVDTKIFGAN